MTTIRRLDRSRSNYAAQKVLCGLLLGCGVLVLSVLALFWMSSSSESALAEGGSNASNLRRGIKEVVQSKRHELSAALQTLTMGNLPARLRSLRDHHEIIGERLAEIRSGTETAHEILHGHDMDHHIVTKPPMELDEIVNYLDTWIHQLHEVLMEAKHATFEGIWQAYHDLTVKTLYPWDREYLSRMPKRREDGSVFLSLATYRDENCFNTVYQAYAKAKNPESLFIGLVQQNCHANCKSGVLANITMVDVPPDDDCYKKFCATDFGKPICNKKQVRILNIDEPESLGPYAARYFASKLWYGEQWFMQTDAHMTFANHWDATSIAMLKKAPSPKPILSHYPPSETYDFEGKRDRPTSRLCGPVFATSDLESQIIRLEGAAVYDKEKLDYPGFAPFTAAGYFVAHSDFLREVPFDPFLPWIFMGEEIIMSSRLWTAGYDIFSPNEAVVGHIYGTLVFLSSENG
jgi:[Skp1-protein]-hydroxyproline N-acetylglucosaminyltransferase